MQPAIPRVPLVLTAALAAGVLLGACGGKGADTATQPAASAASVRPETTTAAPTATVPAPAPSTPPPVASTQTAAPAPQTPADPGGAEPGVTPPATTPAPPTQDPGCRPGTGPGFPDRPQCEPLAGPDAQEDEGP